ncbi:hypothetical protein G7B40_007530 [Aetokthonos hydrillicola Thurmond2011]|jgi:hypothetical protein|uniref:Uncharacterized protein n=1 Tax=Aetokthonos hydrillicola Thurmond2011 TaxID=2712845 RepID=A0AAP5M865_9CYAN|nr:hypothetical protein [Aetokthonos hydrillicola]MBO3460643.1 hypothetical protein [Aetokthonos hydrillicola CCALA 1050]MBW4587775.1 hypothetical protein [Aetokthonos hydrillicola CCALA 1050]MDR9894422.1 hypothetical protein [Aetokthonos hydrillicola Thurmond2011]
MSNQSDPLSDSSEQQTMNNQSTSSQSAEKSVIDKSEYVYELPSWELMPPATFVIRRVRRL